jgi:hypothetical protein
MDAHVNFVNSISCQRLFFTGEFRKNKAYLERHFKMYFKHWLFQVLLNTPPTPPTCRIRRPISGDSAGTRPTYLAVRTRQAGLVSCHM